MADARVWIADPDGANWPEEPTAQLVLLDDCDHTRDGFFVRSMRFPSEQQATFYGNMGEDGDMLAAARHTGGPLVIRLGYRGTDLSNMALDWSELQQAIEVEHGVLVLDVEGLPDLIYYDFTRSQMPQMLTGQDKPWKALLDHLTAPDGLELVLNLTDPWGRGAPIRVTSEDVTNAVTSREVLVYNPGNRPSEMKMIYKNQSGSLAGFRHSLRTHGNLTEWRTLYMKQLSGATMKTDTSAVGDVARTTFATMSEFDHRLRQTFQANDPTTLPGVYKVFLRCKPTGGSTPEKEFKAQLMYGFSSDPVAQIRARRRRKTLDFTDITPDFVEIDMGLIVVPEGVKTLHVDLWAEVIDGDWDMDWSLTILEAADYFHSHIGVPGFRMGEWGRRRYPADELDGTGTLKRNSYRLNAVDEIARTDPAAGFRLQAGLYEAIFDVTLREQATSGAYSKTKLGEGQVRKNPTGADTSEGSVRLRTKKRLKTDRRRRVLFQVSAAEEAAADKFRPQVKHTAAAADGRRIAVHDIVLRFLRAITNEEEVVIDSNIWERTAIARRASDDLPLFPIVHENWLPRIPPGDHLLVLSTTDMPTSSGFDEIDEDEPSGPSVLTRQTNVEIIVTPRYAHPLGS